VAVGSRDLHEPSIKHPSCLIIRSRAGSRKGATARFLSPLSSTPAPHGTADCSLTSGRANATITTEARRTRREARRKFHGNLGDRSATVTSFLIADVLSRTIKLGDNAVINHTRDLFVRTYRSLDSSDRCLTVMPAHSRYYLTRKRSRGGKRTVKGPLRASRMIIAQSLRKVNSRIIINDDKRERRGIVKSHRTALSELLSRLLSFSANISRRSKRADKKYQIYIPPR